MPILKKSLNLGIFSKSIFLMNLLAIIALLLSYLASYISPSSFWPIAFFGLGYLPILIINIGFVIYWLLRKPKHMIYSLAMILLGWGLMTKHVTFSSNTHNYHTDSLIKVMTYNVHLFKNANNESEDIKEDVIDIINETNPDVLCIQEFQSTIKGNKKFSEQLKEACGFKTYYFAPANQNDYHGYGQIIYSKHPIINSGAITQNSFGINRIIFADIIKNEDTIRVYNVHLRSFGLQSEDKEFLQNPSSSSPQNEKDATKRVSRKLKHAFAHRSIQAESLAKHMSLTTYPKIVMGDFNDTPMSYSVNLIGQNMNNAFKSKGRGWGVTHYKMFPILQIDYIFSDYEVVNYEVTKKKLSDHYPVWAELKI